MRDPRRVGVLISGRGSNMRALVEKAKGYKVALIASNKSEAAGLEWARSRGLGTWAKDSKGIAKEQFDRELSEVLEDHGVGTIALAGFMRILSPWFVNQWSGNIVNISSGAIDTPAPTLACYGMTKAAVAMLTKTLATEVGRNGIRVNAIAPGMILTNFSRHNFTDADGNVVPEKLEQYHKRAGAMAPLGRAGEAEDVARSFLYLVSDAAAFVTGQIERPNGGVSMPW